MTDFTKTKIVTQRPVPLPRLRPLSPLPLSIFLGGTRSGKSALAEEYASWCVQKYAWSEADVLYLATADATDPSMRNRIDRHKQRRHELWQTIEIPYNLANDLEQFLQQSQHKPKIILIDCATLWLSNILFNLECRLNTDSDVTLNVDDFENACLHEVTAFLVLIEKYQEIQWIIVSGETGLGGIGTHRLERIFQDGLGLANQDLVQAAKQSFLCVAGRAIPLGIEIPWH